MEREGFGFTGTIRALSNLHTYKKEQPAIKRKGLDATLILLRNWQTQRLERTHADLLASVRFGPACRFFLDEIYSARDFSRRDQEIEYLYSVMSRFLPDFLLGLVRKAIQLNDLSHALDQALLKVLVNDLGVTDTITPQLYAQAYRICDNYSERVKQIELLVEIGQQVDLATRLPLISTTLRLARRPARLAGWGELHNFLEGGYNSFKHMRRTDKFLEIIRQREMSILERIFAGDADPFSLESSI
ncbi:MAG: hypothetical protein JXA78_14530 [Anaerolineales bacterium]|nr:hypothetical protein [Anaerolineales bacterium]